MLSRLFKFAAYKIDRVLSSRLVPGLARLYYGRSLEAYDPSHLVDVGSQYLVLGKYEKALELFFLACKKNPDMRLPAGRQLLGYVRTGLIDDETCFNLLRQIGSSTDLVVPELDEVLLREALKRDPSRLEAELETMVVPGRPSSEAVETLGSNALAVAQNSLALKAYQRALVQRSNNPVLVAQIGIAQFLTALYREAEVSFAHADYLKLLEREHLGLGNAPVAILDSSWLLAIGHVAFLDTYVKACRLGWYPEKKSFLVYDIRNPPGGWPLLKLFSRYINVVGTEQQIHNKIDEIISKELKSRPIGTATEAERARVALSRSFWCGPDGEEKTRWYGPWGAAVETAWKAQGRGALFSLSDTERTRFRRHMADLYGLPEDAWFVLLHVREPGFHANWHAYHAGTRNAEIKSYSEVIDFVLSKGGWVVRGGDSSMSVLEPREGVIDYATGVHKHPALDIYLCAECSYFIGTNSGFSVVPPIFGKRCGLTNWSPIAIPNWYLDDLYIPKLVRKVSEQRYLSFKEMYSSFAGWSQFARDFANSDFVIEDNSPEDLRELAEELHNEVFGIAAAPQAEDATRLERFNTIATTNGSYVGSRMSGRFLKKYAHLLDEPAVPR